MWVGLWGAGPENPKAVARSWLPQLGTESSCRLGDLIAPTHFAVFMLFHNGRTKAERIFEVDVKEGDEVNAVVVYKGREPDGRLHFLLTMMDVRYAGTGAPPLGKGPDATCTPIRACLRRTPLRKAVASSRMARRG
jgi:hypothetical protein